MLAEKIPPYTLSKNNTGFAAIITIGNVSFPIAVLAGVVSAS